jgi:hypothetical protein
MMEYHNVRVVIQMTVHMWDLQYVLSRNMTVRGHLIRG